MGNFASIERRINAERMYVEEGVEDIAELSRRTGHTRNTLTTWCAKHQWKKKRADRVAMPATISDRLKRAIHQLMDDLEETMNLRADIKRKLKAGVKEENGVNLQESMVYAGISEKIDEIKKSVEALYKVDAMFFNKGMMLLFLNTLTDFVAAQSGEGDTLKGLSRIAPLFIDHIEKEMS